MKVKDIKKDETSYNEVNLLTDEETRHRAKASVNGSWYGFVMDGSAGDCLPNSMLAISNGVDVKIIDEMNDGSYFRVLGISCNGLILAMIDLHNNNTESKIYRVYDETGCKVFELRPSVPVMCGDITEFGDYIALSFAGYRNSQYEYAWKVVVFSVKGGFEIKKIDNDARDLFKLIKITSPDQNVFRVHGNKKIDLIG